MAATIKIKNSSTASAVPTSSDLVQGELAVNVTDKRLFTENSGGTVVELGTNPSSITLPDGSASAPTLLHSGDTNTGLFFPAADTVGITTGGTERVRVDSSGNVGIGNSSAVGKLEVYQNNNSGVPAIYARQDGTAPIQTWNVAAGAEKARIDSSGNLLVGTTTGGSSRLVVNAVSSGSALILRNNAGSRLLQVVDTSTSGSTSGTAAVMYLERDSSSSRSVNASGTLNASGADYAEYMTKAGDFTVAKGDVVGINAEGKLTNVFNDAVSFSVKSTDPSYVGNDKWGVELEGDDLEQARQKVDRIAFAGQVPVNVTGATAGQYIVPTNNNGAIIGVAVNEADMTLSQYMKAVGKVIAIEQDGRAKIIVKVA